MGGRGHRSPPTGSGSGAALGDGPETADPAGEAGPVAVRAEGLARTYPNGAVGLRGLDLTIRTGEVVGLLGRSGSGKTTLFRLLVGAIRPSAGRAVVLGTDVGRARRADLARLRRRLAWVGQQHALVGPLSVAHNVLLGRLGRAGLPRALLALVRLPERDRRAAFDALAMLGIEHTLYDRADDLSGGQQQRVAVARAILDAPELVLADEPVASVDERTAADVLGALLRLNRERGSTLVVSLHQPDLALRWCPRIVVLAAGAVAYDGPPDGIDRALLYAHADEARAGLANGPAAPADDAPADDAPADDAPADAGRADRARPMDARLADGSDMGHEESRHARHA